jgi:hypothetical protein
MLYRNRPTPLVRVIAGHRAVDPLLSRTDKLISGSSDEQSEAYRWLLLRLDDTLLSESHAVALETLTALIDSAKYAGNVDITLHKKAKRALSEIARAEEMYYRHGFITPGYEAFVSATGTAVPHQVRTALTHRCSQAKEADNPMYELAKAGTPEERITAFRKSY